MRSVHLCKCLVILLLYTNYTLCHRILGVFPHHGLSHFMMVEPLMLELAKRGHEVVVISRYPQTKKVPNYVDIDVRNLTPDYNNNVPYQAFDKIPVTHYVDMKALYRFMLETEEVLKTPNFQNFFNSEQKFDLMVVENFNTRLFLSIGYKLRIPYIAVSSSVLFPHASYDIANPLNPSYIPALMSYCSNRMTFLERLSNVYTTLYMSIAFEFFFNPKTEEMKEKYFGKDVPSLRVLAKNTSLMLVNSHFTLNGPRPLVPSVIEVGGIFLKESKRLPQDIEKFINESIHGVVYFCMGSLLRGESFPEEKRNSFLYAFSKISQRVLWKWEGDVLPGKSDNIMTSKWLPQRDILAHPNVKLFISHGGLLGTSEAVYEGVPIIGIPVFGDQKTNIRSIEASGAGELLDYNDISKEVVLEKIQRLINDPKYKQNAVELSRRYKDRPMSALDTAIYWVEYVIRHKGAHHLKTAAVNMPWYQYILLDVIAILLLISISVIIIIYYAIKITLRLIYNLLHGNKQVTKKLEKKLQ